MTETLIPPEADSTRLLRTFVLVALIFGLVGMSADLVALKHFEDPWQLVPLALFALALGTLAWFGLGGGAASLRLLRVLMVLAIVAGLVGVVLHYRGNLEFQMEIDPSQHGWALFKEIIHAKAPPALAPGSMIELGLLGIAFTFRHPALRPSAGRGPSPQSKE